MYIFHEYIKFFFMESGNKQIHLFLILNYTNLSLNVECFLKLLIF